MKNKLFYVLTFFYLFYFCTSQAETLPRVTNEIKITPELLEKIKDMQEYSLSDLEPVSIYDAMQKNPIATEPKEDSYWDLAWHARLADYGDRDSQFVIAKAYEEGREIDQNLEKSLYFYKKSAAQGHVEACMRLGHIYSEETWHPKDLDQSLFWYEKAAQEGYIPAQIKTSYLYRTRQNPDFKKSEEWLEKALRSMFPDTQNLEDVSPDLVEIRQRISEQQSHADISGAISKIPHNPSKKTRYGKMILLKDDSAHSSRKDVKKENNENSSPRLHQSKPKKSQKFGKMILLKPQNVQKENKQSPQKKKIDTQAILPKPIHETKGLPKSQGPAFILKPFQGNTTLNPSVNSDEEDTK